MRNSEDKNSRKENKSTPKQVTLGTLGALPGIGYGINKIKKGNKRIREDVKKSAVEEAKFFEERKNEVKKILGEDGVKELDERAKAALDPKNIEKKVAETTKKFRKKVGKKAAMGITIGSGIGVVAGRGELDKDHVKSAISLNPVNMVGGHVAINAGDKQLRKSLEEGKTESQAIRDASKKSEKVSRNASLLGTGIVSGAIAAGGKKVIENAWKDKVLGNPAIQEIVNSGVQYDYKGKIINPGKIICKGDALVKNHGRKLALGVAGVSGLVGAGKSYMRGKNSGSIMTSRGVRKLSKENDKEEKK